jgi:signal transduction histidine kinase
MTDKLDLSKALAFTEEELNRIVLDVHDGPVQNLFAALSVLAQTQYAIEEYNPTSRSVLPNLGKTASLIESALMDIRCFLGAFRSPEFIDQPLTAVIEKLVIQHEEWTNQIIDLTVESLPEDIALPIKTVLYRILQEALSNAFRHSGAKNQWVRVWSEPPYICLEVQDNGRGFRITPEAETPEKHIGLRGMRERVRMVNGIFELSSHFGEGTTVLVKVPAHVE